MYIVITKNLLGRYKLIRNRTKWWLERKLSSLGNMLIGSPLSIFMYQIKPTPDVWGPISETTCILHLTSMNCLFDTLYIIWI